MKSRVEVTGVDQVAHVLATVTPRHAKNLMRATVHGMAGEIRDDARALQPRDEGDLRRATKSKRRRGAPGVLRSDVIVERRAFYWRFLEYGDGPDGVEHAFFARAVEAMRSKMTEVFLRQFGTKLGAALARERKKARGG